MTLPPFITALPALNLPFPETVVTTNAMRTDDALAVFFHFHQDFDLPAHSHGPQWGTVISGEIVFTIGDITRTYHPGDSYDIPAGVVHSARIKGGTIALDVFAEADRYKLKPRAIPST